MVQHAKCPRIPAGVLISMVLLLLTGIVVDWQRSARVDVGSHPQNLYLVSLDPVREGYSTIEAAAFFEKPRQQLLTAAGITSVTVAQSLPLALSSRQVLISTKVQAAGGAQAFGALRAGAGFFATIGTRLHNGREFFEDDERFDRHVIVMNETHGLGVSGRTHPRWARPWI
jgi:hypothetical protein